MRVNGALLALEDPSLLREFQKYAGLYLDKQRKIDPSLRSVSTIPFLKLANHQIGISDWYRALYRSQSSGVDENSRLQPARRTIANFMVISELGYWENCLRYCKQNRVALPMGIKYLEMIALASSQRATAIEDTVFQIQNQTGIIIEKKVLYDQSLLIFADMPEFD